MKSHASTPPRKRGRPSKTRVIDSQYPTNIVKVNNRAGELIGVIRELSYYDKRWQETFQIPLRSPLYIVKILTNKKYPWVTHARQVYIPKGKDVILKLFADEFEKFPQW